MSKKLHNLVVKNPSFRKSLSLDKKTVKDRYEVVYKETFQTSTPGENTHVIFHSRHLLKNKTVLDLGCGAGRLSLYASKYAKSVTGIDYIDSAVDYAKNFANLCNIKNVEFFTGDNDQFLERKYDVILISEVLQHVNNPLKILQRCKKLLNKNGWVIVSVPSFNNFRGTVWLTLQNLFKLPMSLTDAFQISADEMYVMTNKTGFNLVKTIGMSYDWAWAEWGIEDMKRRVYLATKDANLLHLADTRSTNKWLSSNLKFNKQFMEYLIEKRIVKKRPRFSFLNIPKNTNKDIKRYLDDGNTDINEYYCDITPFNRMGALAIYFLKNND
ncbi:MAG: class I SAM-dependent methyltransferase [Nitrosopumilaceae archaeon]